MPTTVRHRLGVDLTSRAQVTSRHDNLDVLLPELNNKSERAQRSGERPSDLLGRLALERIEMMLGADAFRHRQAVSPID